MSNSHWPHDFFLIASGEKPPQHKPSKERMGGKAYNLHRMAALGLPVPPALVIGTAYTLGDGNYLLPLFDIGLPALQRAAGQQLGDERNPLIVSVRSGAPVSMPGMMETLLNIGLCDRTVPGLLRRTGNPRLVWDAYRRLVSSFGEVVAGLPGALFEAEVERVAGERDERALDFSELRALTRRFLDLYEQHAGRPFPQAVGDQLRDAVAAVFRSWDSEKAQAYRRINNIDAAIGTAVTIQTMVFGNSGAHAGAGVGFTRDPTTGERELWVDFLVNAQGEDVVSGRRNAHGHQALNRVAPLAWQRLQECAAAIEHEFGDMQDFEFTVQDGELHMLQTRTGKRTPLAVARIALDLFDEGVIDRDTALLRTAAIEPVQLATLRVVAGAHDAASGSGAVATPLAAAISASAGVVSGAIALDTERARQLAAQGQTVILLRQDAETSDIAALEQAHGLLTQRGARTSHAAVVARQLGLVCLVGCEDLRIVATERRVRIGAAELDEGDVITLDGNDGSIYAGAAATVRFPDEALIARLQALRSDDGVVDAKVRGLQA